MNRYENRKYRNKYIIFQDYCKLEVLYKDKWIVSFIDAEDVEKCKEKTWHYHNGRLQTSHQGKKIFIHHYLFKNPRNGLMIDHKDKNPLNNRKNNLREVSRSVNAINSKVRIDNTTSDIRGVNYQNPSKKSPYGAWVAQWSIDGKRYTKSFSVNKYGEENAYKMAIEYREKILNEMKI